MATVIALRQTYLQDRFILVKREDMVSILKGLGARGTNYELLKSITDQTGADPTLDIVLHLLVATILTLGQELYGG